MVLDLQSFLLGEGRQTMMNLRPTKGVMVGYIFHSVTSKS